MPQRVVYDCDGCDRSDLSRERMTLVSVSNAYGSWPQWLCGECAEGVLRVARPYVAKLAPQDLGIGWRFQIEGIGAIL